MPDVAALDEVGTEQSLFHVQLKLLRLGVVEKLVGENGVGVLDLVVVVVEADTTGDPNHPFDHLANPLLRVPSNLVQIIRGAALEVDRGVRRELEAVELDVDRRRVLIGPVLGQADLEVALADVTPGADDIGPNVDLDRGFGVRRAVGHRSTGTPGALT